MSFNEITPTRQKPKRRKLFCRFLCFKGSSIADSGHFEPPLAAPAVAGKRPTISHFYWMKLWRKKKRKRKISLPNTQSDDPFSAMDEKSEVITNRTRGQSPASPPPPRPEREASAAASVHISTESEQHRLPQLPPNNDARTPRPPIVNQPKVTAGKRGPRRRPGSPQLDRFPVTGPAEPPLSEKLDPEAGLAVLGVTVTVMVFFGRAAAVFCLIACLYLASLVRLPPATKERGERQKSSAVEVDVESEEYKKRVVMEGLLGRNNRRPPVASSSVVH
ncbi:Uncharacterized protein AXF42_Ash015851 [Apostasia shenzhenica]|uniref:Uncharacterized protein n=1 Tax=Apostasia shenzhenica TaxID=1088818 RepID=A0A2H9ZXQ5_9ASPA|nr:Uncharacterized protein AXF42_Ash015851 [Apostasia shenzhenica]